MDEQSDIEPVQVSMDWFHWHFENALNEAVMVHGKEAGAIAWTAREYIKDRLPNGYAKIYSTDRFRITPDGE